MEKQDFVLDVKNLNTSFVSDRKEVRIIKDVCGCAAARPWPS